MNMDNCTKTPVTKLQEYLIRHGTTPQYELIESGIGIHNGTFKYLVTAQGIRAVGAGHSKKEAKHEAAKSALVTILQEGGLSPSQGKKDPDMMALRRHGTSSPHEGDLALEVEDMLVIADKATAPWPGDAPVGNCVGELQDLCMANEMPLATYDLIGDVGPPHNKEFTYRCQVLMQTAEGVSRTKKQAKQLSAHTMIAKLRKSCQDLLSMNSELRSSPNTLVDLEKPCESYKEVINKYKEMGNNLRTTKRAPLGLKVSQYHTSLKNITCEALQDLRDKMDTYSNMLQRLPDPRSCIEEIMKQLQFEMSFEPVESSDDRIWVLVILGTSPEAVMFGSGTTEEDAIKEASVAALNYILLMTK